MEEESAGGQSRTLMVVLVVLAVLCGGGGIGVLVCLGSVITIGQNLEETFEEVSEEVQSGEEEP